MDNGQDFTAEGFIQDLNRTAMSLLRDKKFNPALECLHKALRTLDQIKSPDRKLKLKGITLNNLGCFYKQSKKPNVALEFLKKAYVNEKDGLIDSVNLAATHLNLCTTYSMLGKHDISLTESLKALELMKNSTDYSPNFVSTLVIAYYNTGVEYEYLKCFNEALEYYKNAWDTAGKYLGPSSKLACYMKENFEKAERNLKGKKVSKDCYSFEFVLNRKGSKGASGVSRPQSGRVQLREGGLRSFNSTVYAGGMSRVGSAKSGGNGNGNGKGQRRRVKISQKDTLDLNNNFEGVEPTRLVGNAEPMFKDLGLENVRFLTGDRMQPMHSVGPRVSSAPRTRPQSQKSSKRFGNRALQAKVQKFEQGQDRDRDQEEELREKPSNPTKKIDPKYIKDLHTLFTQRQKKIEKAVLSIQRHFRGFQSRKATKALAHKKLLKDKALKAIQELDFLKSQKQKSPTISPTPLDSPKIPDQSQKLGILSLQSLTRGFTCRQAWKKKIFSSTLIQKTVKMYQVRKIYKKIKEAILFIQSFYRGYLTRKHYLLTI